MIYVYDILLNFNKELVEFFEWEDTDNIKYAKKISLFKITKKVMKDFLNNEIEFNINFLKNTNKYEFDGLENKTSFCLFTDGQIVLGVLIKNRKIDLVSRLIIDEEDEVIQIGDKLKPYNIDYKIIKKKKNNNLILTRKEKVLKYKLKDELDKLYKEKSIEKLEYLYYEYTGKENNNMDYIYNFLKRSLNEMNYKHEKLLDILKLANKNM